MDIATVRTFFMWCTILNGGLLILSSVLCALFGDWIYKKHSQWYPMPRQVFNVVIYSLIASYKILLIVFNLVPYLALVIMG